MNAASKADHRRLLVVAFHYPPDNTSTGVLRTLKFTEYLLRHAWVSEVVSVPERLYYSKDPASVSKIPDQVKVFRTWAADIRELFGFRGVYPGVLAAPDRYWPWFFPACRQAGRLIQGNRPDALYTTYPIPTAHLIGLYLKKRYGLPWVADFRDPWVEDSMPLWRRRFEGYLEAKVIKNADRVICNTPAMRRFFLSRYPALPPAKFVTITNGYDEPDFVSVTPEPIAKFEIFYSGVISGGNRNPRCVLAGVRWALDRGWLAGHDLQITFLGCGAYGGSAEFKRDVEHYRLQDQVVTVEARIPYAQAVNRAAGAAVLLVLSEPLGEGPEVEAERRWSHQQVPAKVYEYLRLGKPMLALVSGGAVAELLEQVQAGKPVAPDDIEGIAAALRDYYQQRGLTAAGPAQLPDRVKSYSRESLSARLATELDGLCDPPGG